MDTIEKAVIIQRDREVKRNLSLTTLKGLLNSAPNTPHVLTPVIAVDACRLEIRGRLTIRVAEH